MAKTPSYRTLIRANWRVRGICHASRGCQLCRRRSLKPALADPTRTMTAFPARLSIGRYSATEKCSGLFDTLADPVGCRAIVSPRCTLASVPSAFADDQQTRAARGLPGARLSAKIVHAAVVQLRPFDNTLPRGLRLNEMFRLSAARKHVLGIVDRRPETPQDVCALGRRTTVSGLRFLL